MRAVSFHGNTFNNVTEIVQNPASLTHTQSTASNSWIADTDPHLPFKGYARFVDAVTADGAIKDAGNADVFELPWVDASYGTENRQARFVWQTPVSGTIRYTARMDNPL